MQSTAQPEVDDSDALRRHAAVLCSMIAHLEVKSLQTEVAEKLSDALTALSSDLRTVRRSLLDFQTGSCPSEVVDMGRDLLIALALLRPALARSTPESDLAALHSSMTVVSQRSDRIAAQAIVTLRGTPESKRTLELIELLRANIAACDYVLDLALKTRPQSFDSSVQRAAG